MSDEWRTVRDYECLYEINELGQVRNCKNKRIKTQFQRGCVEKESLYVGLNKKGKTESRRIDRMLYDAFGDDLLEENKFADEIWKGISGYKEYYMVSNYGNVKSLDRYITQRHKNGDTYERFIKGRILSRNKDNGNGYLIVNLSAGAFVESRNEYVHILVAKHFIENTENKPTVNHIDGNKSNNNLENLEWATYSEQLIHAYDNNLRGITITKLQGESCKSSKLKKSQVLEVLKMLVYNTDSEIAEIYGVCRKTINNIRNNKTWKAIDRGVVFG